MTTRVPDALVPGAGADLARLAGLLADGTRASICLALLDGRAWTAGELARHTGVAPSTATEHLDRLVTGGLVIERRQGRHRYVQLAGPEVAHLIEDLSAQAEPWPRPVSTLRAATASAALARGRTCYDHLAGKLGVAISDAMFARELLQESTGLAITDAGVRWLTDVLGASLSSPSPPSRRPLVRACLDWTERRTHLAGVAGSEICRRLFDQEWIVRVGSGRAVRVTPAGVHALKDLLGVDVTDLG
jgi:DNA-binding transcriptional ArsR family regulator